MKAVVFFSAVAAAIGLACTAVVYVSEHYPRIPQPADAVVTAEPDPASAAASAPIFEPPPVATIPDDEYGRQAELGRAIFNGESSLIAPFVGNALRCASCHLGEGRLPHAAPLWAGYVAYPAYRSRNARVDTFAERLRDCFRYNMDGQPPPLGDRVLVALETYAHFLAKGAPTGAPLQGRGYPSAGKPAQAPDPERGRAVYEQRCALCHGADGQGQAARGITVFPPLWGPKSFNWGSAMSSIERSAGFIKANMPLGNGNSLSTQDAWDVASFVGRHDRPQDPRFNGSVEQTRLLYHGDDDHYGRQVDGVTLGALPLKKR